MFSSKVLILALILACAVLVHSDCEVKSDTCESEMPTKIKNFVKAIEECDGKEEKEKCESGCFGKLIGTPPANAYFKHNCKLENEMKEMKEGADKDCCKTMIAYIASCIAQGSGSK